LDILQQIGESRGLMSLNDEILDDWVPVEVVQSWVCSYIHAYANLFDALHLGPVDDTDIQRQAGGAMGSYVLRHASTAPA